MCVFISLCVKLSGASSLPAPHVILQPAASLLPTDSAGQLFPAVQAILTLNWDLSSAPAPVGWAEPASEARDVEGGGETLFFFFLITAATQPTPSCSLVPMNEARETLWNLVKSQKAQEGGRVHRPLLVFQARITASTTPSPCTIFNHSTSHKMTLCLLVVACLPYQT